MSLTMVARSRFFSSSRKKSERNCLTAPASDMHVPPSHFAAFGRFGERSARNRRAENDQALQECLAIHVNLCGVWMSWYQSNAADRAGHRIWFDPVRGARQRDGRAGIDGTFLKCLRVIWAAGLRPSAELPPARPPAYRRRNTSKY